MEEQFMKQIFAELIAANEQAIGLIVAAMSRQMDAQCLVSDLRDQISAAERVQGTSTMAIRFATNALAAAEAEVRLRRQDMVPPAAH